MSIFYVYMRRHMIHEFMEFMRAEALKGRGYCVCQGWAVGMIMDGH